MQCTKLTRPGRATKHRNVRGPAAFVRDVNTTPVVLFATVDHLGRVLELRDGTRTVIWSLVTQPFGEQHALTGTTPFLGRYPGQWHQAETGLAHNWHRWGARALGIAKMSCICKLKSP
jgi:hypothetical protein